MSRFIVLAGLLAGLLAGNVRSQGFTFRIGNPVASQDYQFKVAAFVFRTEGCADPTKASVAAIAEGLVKGQRRSIDLQAMATSKSGVYAVPQTWPSVGNWVVALRGTCGDATAGAIVPFNRQGFIRESSKFLPRTATTSEIDASLKALADRNKDEK
jgi:hypothetical protein